MPRIQLALNVDDIDAAVAFYAALFRTEPAKRRPGYANFAVASPPLKLVLLENPGHAGTLNHLGVEVESVEQVDAEIVRLREAGMIPAEEKNTTCCYATQDKAWVTAPGGEPWEIYTVLADSATFSGPASGGASDEAKGAANERAGGETSACCGSNQRAGDHLAAAGG
jgi:catechol 2,3-dioxygenase-like lactoylglutathione lyase family enzyme